MHGYLSSSGYLSGDSYDETFPLKLMVLLGGMFERWLDHEGESYISGITGIVNNIQQNKPPLLQCNDVFRKNCF